MIFKKKLLLVLYFYLASTFSQSLDHLASVQNEIRDQVRSQKDSLDKVVYIYC